MRDTQLAEGIGGYDLGLARGGSIGVISSRAREGVELDRLAEPMLDILADLAQHGPSESELARAKAGFEREWLSALAPVEDRADQLGFYATHFDDPLRINEELDEIERLEPTDIARVAARWFDPDNRATLRYQTKGGAA